MWYTGIVHTNEDRKQKGEPKCSALNFGLRTAKANAPTKAPTVVLGRPCVGLKTSAKKSWIITVTRSKTSKSKAKNPARTTPRRWEPSKVGDVLHSVYGYDMILNSYYEVVKVSPSDKTVQIRPLRKDYEGSPNDIAGCTVYPDVTSENRFTGKPDSHRVLVDNNGEPYVKISTYEYAHPINMKEAVYGSTEDHND